MKKILAIILAMMLFPAVCFGATALSHETGSDIYTLTVLDGDYTLPAGLSIVAIMFVPDAAADECKLEDATSGQTLVHFVSGDGEPRVAYFYKARMDIFFDQSDNASADSGTIIIVTNPRQY